MEYLVNTPCGPVQGVAGRVPGTAAYKGIRYATITEGNESSIAFHQAAGYRHIATLPNSGYKFGKWYGVHWLEKELNTWDTPPCAPIPIHRLLVK